MAKIKRIKVDAISLTVAGRTVGYYWNYHTFTTFTDDKGNKTYFIGDKEVSKEEGNKRYLEIKKSNAEYQKSEDCKKFIKREWASFYRDKKAGRKPSEYLTLHEADTFKQKVEEYEISYEELIEKLDNSIDRYVQYIDDGKQYDEAVANNERIREKIRKLEQLIKER